MPGNRRGRERWSSQSDALQSKLVEQLTETKYVFDVDQFISETQISGSLADPATLPKLVAALKGRLEEELFRILSDLEATSRKVPLDELEAFFGNREDAAGVAGPIMTWIGESLDKFNDKTGIGRHSHEKWYEWERKLIASEFKSTDPAPNTWSANDDVERIGDDLTDLMYGELAAMLSEEQARQKHQEKVLTLRLSAGEVFAGNRAARRIFSTANKSLEIIDTYIGIGPELFDMLEITASTVHIRIITDKAKLTRGARLAYQQFKRQYRRVQLRTAPPKTIHDRYIIIDHLAAVHVGHSIKDLGTKMAEVHPIDAPGTLTKFEVLWSKSLPVS